MKLVVDTSVILKWFVHTENDLDESLWYSFVPEDLIVPDLVYAEAASALSKKVARGEIGDEQARGALQSLSGHFSETVASGKLFQSAYELSRTLNHPVYDCFFLAAAVSSDGRQLLTADSDFTKKVIGKGFGEYSRMVGHLAVSVDTLGGQQVDLGPLAAKIGEVESLIFQRVEGSSVDLLTERIVNLPDIEPEFERSWFGIFKKSLSSADENVLRNIISVCWLGRPLSVAPYKQLYHDSGELTRDPERHAFYIASLLPYFDRGIERLTAPN